ncbi:MULTISPECIES: hypothetical protein [unclassified Haladaptatus]|uniref:hypothetical protein n=1 Tax=unclassified Haladaptatus TaxID=2622732 RepID=UPI0023E8564C|nr:MULTISPECIES: hypothetical protein [unclassified Haladaptatus]
MPEADWLRQGGSIGRTEFRRTVRALRADRARFALIGFGLVAMTLFMSAGAFFFAVVLRDVSTPIELPATVYGTLSLFWFFAVFLFTQRISSQRPRIDADELMRATVSTRAIATGLVIAEFFRAATYLTLPSLLLSGAVVYGLRAPLLLVSLPVAVLVWVLTAVIVGAVLGFGGALLVAKSRFVARHKTVLGSVAALLAMGGYFVFQIPQGPSVALLAWTPFGWFIDVVTLGSPIASSPLRVVGGLLTVGCLVVGGGWLVERITAELWFTDPVDPDETPAEPARATAPTADSLAEATHPLSIPAGILSQPTRRVAQLALVRTRRDPHRLLFLFFPLIFLTSFLGPVVRNPELLRLVAPPALALLLPWLAGGLFALNPLGDEGALLPGTLTAIPSGSHYVRGLASPGLLLCLPLALALPAVSGLVSPYSLRQIGALTALSALLTLCAVALAPAIGMRFPRFSAITTRRSRDIVPPSLSAVALYSLSTAGLGAVAAASLLVPATARMLARVVFSLIPGAILSILANQGLSVLSGPAYWFAGVGPHITDLSLSAVRWGGYAVPMALACLLALVGYRNAVTRFNRYTIA